MAHFDGGISGTPTGRKFNEDWIQSWFHLFITVGISCLKFRVQAKCLPCHCTNWLKYDCIPCFYANNTVFSLVTAKPESAKNIYIPEMYTCFMAILSIQLDSHELHKSSARVLSRLQRRKFLPEPITKFYESAEISWTIPAKNDFMTGINNANK